MASTTVQVSGRDQDVDPWLDTSLPARERARLLTHALTLEEKVAQLGSVWLTDAADDFAPTLEAGPRAAADVTDGLGQLTRVFGSEPVTVTEGVRRLRELQQRVMASQRHGIPAIAHEECLTGLAAYGATAFPTPLAWAATFDEALVEQMARAIGEDLRAIGVHQGLAPVVDVVKDYRWGRVEETLGEDPYLVAQLGAAYVAGLEGAGIIATLKHFAGYAASRGARNHAPVSMGPRELADTVLPPFETAVRLGGARSVMTSYADVDGVPGTANAELLGRILRDSWGFEGTVVADYWAIPFLAAMHHVVADVPTAGALALRAGVDVELPQTAGYASLAALVLDGLVDEADVDRAVERHLRQKIEAGLLNGGPVVPARAEHVDLDSPPNRAISSQLAAESVVLLRNEEVLPIAPATNVALLGPAAAQFRSLVGCYAFPNHVLAKHPGHDLGIAIPTVLDAAIDELGPDHVRYAQGCGLLDDDRSGIGEATALARESDVAVTGLLSGRVRPTGRLPVQIPRHPWASTTYLQPALGGFNPGISTLDARPLYPFGYGLTDGAIVYDGIEAPAELVVDGTAEVDVTVRNGGRETVEVVQLYASFPTSPVVRPTVQLVGYARLPLPAGATRTVRFRLEAARLAATGVDGLLALEPGDVVLSSGPSAADLPLTAPVRIVGSRRVLPRRSLRTPWSLAPAEPAASEGVEPA